MYIRPYNIYIYIYTYNNCKIGLYDAICYGTSSLVSWKYSWPFLWSIGSIESIEVESDIFTYNSAISACAKASNWQAACQVLQLLLLSDVQPDTISYSSVITACERSSLWQLAIQFLRESWTCRTPDVVAFTGTIAACEKAGRWQLALLLLSKMPEDEILPDVVSFGSAICACAPWFWSTGMFNVSSFWILDKTERRSWNPAIKSSRREPILFLALFRPSVWFEPLK